MSKDNLTILECPGCKANLEIDLDHMIAFCPYCGKKLTYTFDGMSDVLTAKEKTKQIQDINQYDLDRIKLQYKEERRSAIIKELLHTLRPIIVWVVFMIVFGLFLWLTNLFG